MVAFNMQMLTAILLMVVLYLATYPGQFVTLPSKDQDPMVIHVTHAVIFAVLFTFISPMVAKMM